MLNEKHHAFLAACFYREMLTRHPENGRDVFLFATRKYAEERGARMAQRALRDGFRLTSGSYRAYGEWSYTDPTFNVTEELENGADYRYRVTKCPWNTQFAAMGMSDCAGLYCSDLDLSIARGFCPDIRFEVGDTMHKNGHCDFCLRDADDVPAVRNSEDNRRPFEYQCAHLFSTFARCAKNVYDAEGAEMAQAVERAFGAEYGDAALAALRAKTGLDFLSVDAR